MKRVFLILFAAAIALSVSALYIAQSDWLRDQVRQRVMEAAERVTGGKVEIARFQFDWKTLTAELDGLTIHGTEPASAQPLLQVRKFVLRLKIVSLVKRDIDILSAQIEGPCLALILAPDGSTNVPSPKIPSAGSKGGIETILDLKIAAFSLTDGVARIDAAGRPPKTASYSVAGRNLQSKLAYQSDGPQYSGTISVQPLRVRFADYLPADIAVEVSLALGKNRLDVSSAKLSTGSSRIEFSGNLSNFSSPAISAKYKSNFSLEELTSLLKIAPRQSGKLELTGDARYSGASHYLLTGKLSANTRSNISATSSYRVDPNTIVLSDLTARVLGGTVRGKAVIHNLNRYEASGTVSRFDVQSLMSAQLPYDGFADGPFTVSGLIPDPGFRHFAAAAKLAISPDAGRPVNGLIDAKYDGSSRQITLAPSYLALPNSRLDLNGVLGQSLRIGFDSRDLNDLLPALKLAGQPSLPVGLRSGSLHFDGSITGEIDSPVVDGHVSASNIVYSDQLVDLLTANVNASETGVVFRNANFTYKKIRAAFSGSLGLAKWRASNASPLAATASLQDGNLPALLALAGRKDIPVTGTLGMTAQISGTLGAPQANATFNLINGIAYNEPFDRVTGKLESPSAGVETLSARITAGARQIALDGTYRHAANDVSNGKLHFKVGTNRMALTQFAIVRAEEPGLAGNLSLNAEGDLAISPAGVRLTSIDGAAQTTGAAFENILLSDISLTARTEAGIVKARLKSNLIHADISGDGTIQLASDYPATAQIHFAKVDLAVARKLFMPGQVQPAFTFGGTIEGNANIAGKLLKPESLTADVEVPQLELRPDSTGPLSKELADLTIRNTRPIRATLATSVVRVESARFTGKNTDLSILGSIDLKQKNGLNLNLNGNLDLKLARTFNTDVNSSGNLLVRVTLRGSFDHPELGGTADLRNGNISFAGFPNGLSKANGRISFDQNRANIERLTAQTGGGSIELSGFTAFGRPAVSFRLTAAAKGVRVRYPEGVSSVSDANLTWTGSTERSVLGGDITVHKVSYNQQNDIGSVLSLTGGGPAPTQAAPTGLLGGTQFDVRVQTAPDVSFQTGLVSGLQTEANLRLRGTAANPALLGRITVNSGNIEFLGNKYLIQEGTVSFFNPVRIDPILNVDLQTQAQGVDVTLSISGPLTKLNVTYRSDPPLQFSDIVGLLATGKTPSDPTIAARQTDTQQTWQQLGASALLGQAIANPVSGRLQRFFGVSKIKIDPLLPGLGGAGSGTGGSNPGARLSLEQQVAPNVTFDYVISTNSTSSQIVRVEWAFSKNWSAVILREENSAFGIDFQYKKRFK